VPEQPLRIQIGADDSRVVVVRHGETEWSRSGRHTSRTDLPLTDAGRKAAERLVRALPRWDFALVLCSPKLRARETCHAAGLGGRAVIDEDLCEWDYGDYEGLTTAEIRARRAAWNLWTDGCPGGESPAQVGARADRVLDGLRAAGGDTIVFAHGHILRVLAARWLEFEPAVGARFALSAGGIGVLGHERATAVLERWNEQP
jgi:probable phosphoglycerate mutase